MKKKNRTVPFILELMFLFTCIFILPCLVFSGEYILVEGKGVEVCEAYKNNLNSFMYPFPMSCEREINPKFTAFKKPKWKELDVLKNRETMKPIIEFVDGTSYPGWLEETIKYGHIRIYETYVDIENDGNIEKILKYYRGECQSTHLYGIPLLVLTDKGDNVDVNKTKNVLLEDADRGYTMYDVFVYKNITYFDRWSDLKNERGLLKVFKIVNGKRIEICNFHYHE